jgi:hypothetical protein
MKLLEQRLPLYSQMIDPTLAGPAHQGSLRIFDALNALNVITVRPLMLAINDLHRPQPGLDYVLRLVVRRIIVGNLGTGNIERRFSDAARRVKEAGSWEILERDLGDLNPSRDEFVEQLAKRSYNKGTLGFVRNSIAAGSIAPDRYYTTHFVLPKTAPAWDGFSDDERSYWGSTIGNTFLSVNEKRLEGSTTWPQFKAVMLPTAAPGEWKEELEAVERWDADVVKEMGQKLSESAAKVWYGA